MILFTGLQYETPNNMMNMTINYFIGHNNKKLYGVINENKDKLSFTFNIF